MGSSRLNSSESEEGKSKVEYISLTKMFEDLCPIYMGYGMTYDEYWYGEPYRSKFYREAHEIKVKQKDEEFWIQGMYIYDALCRVSPILHAFSKSGTKPLPYPEKPYLTNVGKKITEEDKERQRKNDELIAQIHFANWARATAKHFNEQNK